MSQEMNEKEVTEKEVTKKKSRFLSRFSAVDLVTIALFAVLLRFVFLYAYKALYVVFPWNQAVFPVFMAITMAMLMKIVPKKGAVLLWTITWQLINMFMQGEVPLYVLGAMPIPFIVEFVIYSMTRGKQTVDSKRVIFTSTMVYTAGFKIYDWIALNYMFLIPYPIRIALIVSLIAIIISNNIGAYLGIILGQKIKTLVG